MCERAHTRLCSEAVRGARGRERLEPPHLLWAGWRGGGRGPARRSARLGSQRRPPPQRPGPEGGSVSRDTVNTPAARRLSGASSGQARPCLGRRPVPQVPCAPLTLPPAPLSHQSTGRGGERRHPRTRLWAA